MNKQLATDLNYKYIGLLEEAKTIMSIYVKSSTKERYLWLDNHKDSSQYARRKAILNLKYEVARYTMQVAKYSEQSKW